MNQSNQANKGEAGERTHKKVKKAFLVYQAGIANVFAVDCLNLSPFGRNARRLQQHAFAACENFARGLGAAGVVVRTAHCNQAGDITDATWSENLESAPFSDEFSPVKPELIP